MTQIDMSVNAELKNTIAGWDIGFKDFISVRCLKSSLTWENFDSKNINKKRVISQKWKFTANERLFAKV